MLCFVVINSVPLNLLAAVWTTPVVRTGSGQWSDVWDGPTYWRCPSRSYRAFSTNTPGEARNFALLPAFDATKPDFQWTARHRLVKEGGGGNRTQNAWKRSPPSPPKNTHKKQQQKNTKHKTCKGFVSFFSQYWKQNKTTTTTITTNQNKTTTTTTTEQKSWPWSRWMSYISFFIV